MGSFSSTAFSSDAFSINAFDFGTGPTPSPSPAGGHFLPEHHKDKYRKTPPGNIRLVYDKIKESDIEPSPILEAIEEFLEPEVYAQAKADGHIPNIREINYAALAQNEIAYQKFTTALDCLRENLRVIAEKKAQEDDELLLITVFACTIN